MRGSGILLPVSSLNNPYGIGTLGKEAYEFIDFLAAAGQKYWQVLPLGPTTYGDSLPFPRLPEIPIISILTSCARTGYSRPRIII